MTKNAPGSVARIFRCRAVLRAPRCVRSLRHMWKKWEWHQGVQGHTRISRGINSKILRMRFPHPEKHRCRCKLQSKKEVSNTKDAPGYTRNGSQPRHVHGHDERGGRYAPTLTARTRSTSRARRSFVTWLDSLIQDIGFSAGQARKIFGNPTRNLKASLILPRYSMCSFPVIRGQGSLRREPVHRSAWQAGW